LYFSATFSAVSPIDCSGKRSAIFGFSKRQPRLVSKTFGGVRANASSLFANTNGARVMLSTPPAITQSASPVHTRRTASLTASRPEPQRRLTVIAGTSYGRFASSAAMRATLRLSSPAWFVAPKTTWSTRATREGARVASVVIRCAARSSARTGASAPRCLPMGVRRAWTRYAGRIAATLVRPLGRRYGGAMTMRELGRTGAKVEAVSLGGEGILRTHGRSAAAVPMIEAALRDGVRYCDTAPAYDGSQGYYGEAFARMQNARDGVFLASKTHERSRAGARALLARSLATLGTDRLDLWQMHDLRTEDDVDELFARGGAIEAAEEAKATGQVRFVGLTGHHDPAILLAAMDRYAFDCVLLPVNAADPARLPFVTTVIPAARARGMGVIGMKVLAAGRLVDEGAATAEECIRYAMAHVDTMIIGCSSPAEVRANLALGRTCSPMSEEEQRMLERRLAPRAARYAYFKR
jgi:diketogulonate reductase-like aldo/keto reductase